jgi:trk system potassium uptake protein TrkH
MILIGTVLLLLPISTRNGEKTGVLGALFTATSASCVTGLAVYDTYTHWSLFGQLVLLVLIQIGGLGFITIGVGFAMAFRKRIGLRQRDLLKESVNAFEIGGIIRLWREIMIGTLFFEGVGALLLAIRFIPEFGIGKGIYYSIFHSISAFCNAGFDLMGTKAPYSSFSDYVTDPVVNITLCLLITIGSLGFIVWKDLWENRFHWKKYMLHTKIVLTVTAVLFLGGTLLMYLFEKDNTLAGFGVGGKLIASMFGAVTPRTAGFNTVDTAALTPAARLLTILFMFIGGSPGSTAGGIKTTTVAVMLVYVFSNLRNSSGCNLFKRRISDDVIKKASMVFCLNLLLALVSCILILGTSHLAMEDVLFEVFSAISTVGMTTGITRDLNTFGRIVIIFLMYCGRIGSMTFALSLIQRPSQQEVTYPAERVTIG